MRNPFLLSVLAAALVVSTPAHAVLDCWPTIGGDTICHVFSATDPSVNLERRIRFRAAGPPLTDERTIDCEDAAWLLWDYCPVIEDTGGLADADEDEASLCEDAPLLVEEFCGSQ